MSKFIKVSGSKDPTVFLINVDIILWVQSSDENGVQIVAIGEGGKHFSSYYVRESLDEIYKMLETTT